MVYVQNLTQTLNQIKPDFFVLVTKYVGKTQLDLHTKYVASFNDQVYESSEFELPSEYRCEKKLQVTNITVFECKKIGEVA